MPRGLIIWQRDETHNSTAQHHIGVRRRNSVVVVVGPWHSTEKFDFQGRGRDRLQSVSERIHALETDPCMSPCPFGPEIARPLSRACIIQGSWERRE